MHQSQAFQSEATTSLQKLLDDHLPALRPSIHPSHNKLEPSTTYIRSSQRSYAFSYSTRAHPTSPAALNCVASDVLSFSVFHAKASRAHSEPRLGAFELLSASCASIPRDSATCSQSSPEGALRLSYLCSLFSFLLTNSANPSLRRGIPAVTTLVGRNGLTGISKEIKIQASHWYLHAFITTLAYPWIWASAAQSRSSPGDINYSLQVDALLFHTSVNMEERLSSPESIMNIQKKRKRSPYASDSESQTMVGDSTSEANNGLASGHTSPAEQRASSLDIGPKRTRLDGLSPASDLTIAQPAARAKVPSRLSELPPELLQHIFTFLPPLFLGRLLRVNRVINTLLDPSKVLPRVHHESQGCLSLLDQDQVWSVSRKRFIPGLPRPLSSVSELELWRLLLGSSCQFCGKRTTLDPPSAVSPWNSGPGTDSVRIIWPFAVRSCGSCLSARLLKVILWSYLQ